MIFNKANICVGIKCKYCSSNFVQLQQYQSAKPFVRYFTTCYLCFKTYSQYNNTLAKKIADFLQKSTL